MWESLTDMTYHEERTFRRDVCRLCTSVKLFGVCKEAILLSKQYGYFSLDTVELRWNETVKSVLEFSEMEVVYNIHC
jgi:hypothetical protein